MAKNKRKADKVHSKKKKASEQAANKTNPFDFHSNKRKFKVLNEKVTRNEKSKALLSRERAFKKTESELKELQMAKKRNNILVDKRVKPKEMEEVLMKKKLKRSKFNLNDDDDEDLSLAFAAAATSSRKNDDDGDDDSLDEEIFSEVVKASHFARDEDGKETEQAVDEGGKKKSARDKFNEAIRKFKDMKYLKQSEKEEVQKLTEETDKAFKEVAHLIIKRKKDPEPVASAISDDYDKIMYEIMFDKRSTAAPPLKSEEALAKEARERLKELEEERLRRMRNASEEQEHAKKRKRVEEMLGVEALESEEVVMVRPNQSSFTAVYDKEGKLIVPKEEKEEERADDSEALETVKKKKSLGLPPIESPKVHRELPFVFEAPQTYEEFVDLLEGYQPEDRNQVLSRLIKCNHPKISDAKRLACQEIARFVLRFLQEAPLSSLGTVDALQAAIYELARALPHAFARLCVGALKAKQAEFEAVCRKRANGRGNYPDVNTLLMFKMVRNLYPTSDYKHPVTIPCMIFMGQILSQCSVLTRRDIAAGLFISNLFLECVALSKRFVPEAINFLTGLVFLAVKRDRKQDLKVGPPFRNQGPSSCLLVLETTRSSADVPTRMKISDLVSDEKIDDEFRIRTLNMSLRLLSEFVELYDYLESCVPAFSSVKTWCSLLDPDLYPPTIQETRTLFLDRLARAEAKTLRYMTQGRAKPKMLKTYEPRFESDFSGKRKFPSQEKDRRKTRNEYRSARKQIRRENTVMTHAQIAEEKRRTAESQRRSNLLMADLQREQCDINKIKMGKRNKK